MELNKIRKSYINLTDSKNFYEYHKTAIGSNYLYPRHSSKSRILINSTFSTLAAFSFGIGRAIYLNKSKLKYGFVYSIGGLISSLAFYQVNEIITGMLIRNQGKEQYFLTNTLATMLVGGAAFGILSIFRRGNSYQNLVECQSHFLSLGVMANLFDFQILLNRRGKLLNVADQVPIEPYQPLKKVSLRRDMLNSRQQSKDNAETQQTK